MSRILHLKNDHMEVYGEMVDETDGLYIVTLLGGDHPLIGRGGRLRVIKGIPGITITEPKTRGRPKSYSSNADKQRAYRERVKGNPLRNYESKH